MRIGIFDSGVGGLTVLSELLKALPNCEFVYLGDTARTPYGNKGPSTIRRYASECVRFLLGFQPSMIVVACNTVSAHALDLVEAESGLPVVGTVDPAVEEVRRFHSRRIGVIGTEATIRSDVYQRAVATIDSQIQIHSKACPLFVPLVEEGLLDAPVTDEAVKLYLSEFKGRIDALILGCTHYPLLERAIRKFIGNDVRLIECSSAIAKFVSSKASVALATSSRQLPLNSVMESSLVTCYATDGIEKFASTAGRFLAKSLKDREISFKLASLEAATN